MAGRPGLLPLAFAQLLTFSNVAGVFGQAHLAAQSLATVPARLNYENPMQTPVQSWYGSLIPTRSPGSVFYAVLGHRLGVLGLRQVGDIDGTFRGTAVFSMMEAGNAAVASCGGGAICKMAGQAGQNRQVEGLMDFAMDQGEKEYSFMISASLVSHSVARYAGYFYAEEVGSWQLLATIDVGVGSATWRLDGLYSYIQEYEAAAPAAFTPQTVAWGMVGPTFVEPPGKEGQWAQVESASLNFVVGPGEPFIQGTSVHANVTDFGRRWGLGSEGPKRTTRAQGESLRVQRQSNLPVRLVSFCHQRTHGLLEGGPLGGSNPGSGTRPPSAAPPGGSYTQPSQTPHGFSMGRMLLLIFSVCLFGVSLLATCLLYSKDTGPGENIRGPSPPKAQSPIDVFVEALSSAIVFIPETIANSLRKSTHGRSSEPFTP